MAENWRFAAWAENTIETTMGQKCYKLVSALIGNNAFIDFQFQSGKIAFIQRRMFHGLSNKAPIVYHFQFKTKQFTKPFRKQIKICTLI
jgi:hypothetical protein